MSDTSTGTQIVSWVSLGLGIIGLLIGAINHKSIRSRCCGREATISLDIDNTTPKGTKVEALTAEKKETVV